MEIPAGEKSTGGEAHRGKSPQGGEAHGPSLPLESRRLEWGRGWNFNCLVVCILVNGRYDSLKWRD